MAATKTTLKKVIHLLLRGKDYRTVVINLIDDAFLQFAIDFFKKVAEAKLQNEEINDDWYKKSFLDEGLPPKDFAIHAGLNAKTIRNSYNTGRKEVVISASADHYQSLLDSIKELTSVEDGIDLNLTIKFKKVSVDLNISESLIVINALAVKRSALRGGSWSDVGKGAEKPLMEVLCKLYSVPPSLYRAQTRNVKDVSTFAREVDFYFTTQGKELSCEVKLMGTGNPESADGVIARRSNIFVADKLSDTNKKQLDDSRIEWVELRSDLGFRRFKTILENLQIPHEDINEGNLESDIEEILEEVTFG